MPIQTEAFLEALKALKPSVDSGEGLQEAVAKYVGTCSEIMEGLDKATQTRLETYLAHRWGDAGDEGERDQADEVYAKFTELREIVKAEQGGDRTAWTSPPYQVINTCMATAEIAMCPPEFVNQAELAGALGIDNLDLS